MALESLLVLPLVVLVVAGVLATSTVVVDQLAVARAARAAARSVALTGEQGTASQIVHAVRPGAVASVRVQGGVAHVTVVLRGAVAGVPYSVDATASAPLEPAASVAGG